MHSDGTPQLPPMTPGVFNLPDHSRPPALLGGACPDCGRDFFPRPPRCPHCLGPVRETSLGSEGVLYTYTMVRVKPPWGLPCPYGLGYVDLANSGLRVLGLMDPAALDQLSIGLPMRLAVGELGVDLRGNPCLRPYFTPAAQGGGHV